MQDGLIEDVPNVILEDALSDRECQLSGSIHPRLMGGEYLPDFEPSEIEIARVSYESVTFDQATVRDGRVICYRIVDRCQRAL